MNINYDVVLKKILINYLKQSSNKNFFFADSSFCYNQEEFCSKILKLKKELSFFWKNKNINRGVGILLDRNVDYIAMIFATWLCNGYYVPLSISSPKKNINYQITNSNVSIVAYQRNGSVKFKKISTTKKKNAIKDKQIAYIIFTSGSTGEKKGVIIEKSSFVNYIKNLKKIFFKKNKPQSILINGEMTFDISLADIAFAFIFNAGLSITNNSRNTISLINMVYKYKINSLYVVPSTLKNIIYFFKNNKKYNFDFLKQINCGGEVLSYNLVKSAKKVFKKANFYNFYGPTEFTINSTYHKINFNRSYKNSSIPIGQIFPNLSYIIFKSAKDERYGELLLSGQQQMFGYTNAKNPFQKIKNKTYYRTGDLVTENKKGEIFFITRKKDYVKHLGYRINLDNIQNVISKYLDIECKVAYKSNNLIAFIKTERKLNSIFINKKISYFLENYELPNKFIFLKDFYYSSSGKIDTKKMIKRFIK